MNEDARQRIERARRIEDACKENGGVFDILQKMKADTLQKAVNIGADDINKAAELLREVRVMDRLAKALADVIQSGAHEAAELQAQAEERSSRIRTVT